jgi:hypothetical protein
MGIWGTIAGIGASLIPGVGPVLGPVVGGIVNGAEQTKAAHTAADQQVAAGNKALDLYSGIYGQQRSDLSPYRNAGSSALSREMSLLGLDPSTLGSLGAGMQSNSGSSGGNGPANGLTRNSSANYPLEMGAISDPNANGGYAGQVPGTATLGDPGGFANNTSTGYAPHSQPQPNFKGLTPDGRTVVVPFAQRAEFEQNNGKILGTA